MKKYLRPTIVFAAASAGGPSSCLNNVNDLEIIKDILAGYDINKLFGVAEACEIGVDYFCKFTSVESGSEQVFLS